MRYAHTTQLKTRNYCVNIQIAAASGRAITIRGCALKQNDIIYSRSISVYDGERLRLDKKKKHKMHTRVAPVQHVICNSLHRQIRAPARTKHYKFFCEVMGYRRYSDDITHRDQLHTPIRVSLQIENC